jgi:hypothetical protein
MFSIPNTQLIFRDPIIHFGASYKSMEYEWHEWIIKFEIILKQLYWYNVELVLESEIYGDYKYQWVFDPYKTKINLDPPEPTSEWIFKGGPRKFNI